jgi:hypothetical protein
MDTGHEINFCKFTPCRNVCRIGQQGSDGGRELAERVRSSNAGRYKTQLAAQRSRLPSYHFDRMACWTISRECLFSVADSKSKFTFSLNFLNSLEICPHLFVKFVRRRESF